MTGKANASAHGGKTVYGATVGMLMLDTVFPRIPGDFGNAATTSAYLNQVDRRDIQRKAAPHRERPLARHFQARFHLDPTADQE